MQNFTPKPFTPSPIAQEKIAIFDQPAKSYQSPIRRPLITPNQVVRNKSPAPYGGLSSPYDNGYGSGSWQQPQQLAPQPQPSYPPANSYQSNRLSGCSFTSSSTPYAPSASTFNAVPTAPQHSPRVHFDLSHQENYNRAARGWGQSGDYYRPIDFNKPQPVQLPYTDF